VTSLRSSLLAVATLVVASVTGCGAPEQGDPGDERVGEADESVVVCAAGPTVEGIDVSYYQGTIDWNQVAAAGKAFGVARINDGNFMDPQFDANWAGMKAAGMIRGAYQFYRPSHDPVAQADVVIQKVGKLGPGDLPVMLDMEATDGVGPATITAQLHTWVDRVTQGTGKPPLVYTGKYFWDPNVQTADFAGLPLWIAAYVKPCPNTPNAWSNWAFWQYNDNGKIPGIGPLTDVDVWNGDLNSLRLFVGLGYGASYVSQSYPMTMTAGDTADVELELKNIGGQAWDGSTHLGTTGPRDRSSDFAGPEWLGPNRPVGVTGSVAPGDTYKFKFKLHAPMKPGKYTEHWDLVQEQIAWFADQMGPADDQMWFEINVVDKPPPSTMSTSSSSSSSGAHSASSSSGGLESGAGGGGPDDEIAPTDSAVTGRCSCEAPGSSPSQSALPIAALALVALSACRRRSSRAADSRR
jgi:lysozyme